MDSLHCLQADASFGPQIPSSCRSFDFTRLFEESFFSIAPSALFLIVATFRAWCIFFKRPIARKGWLYRAKLLAIGLLAVIEITQLIVGTRSVNIKTHTTIPSYVIAMAGTLVMLLLSHLEHCRSFRASSILCTYLFFSLLLDIPQVRTLQISNHWQPTSTTFVLAMGLKILVLLLESQGKRQLLRLADQNRAPEEMSNVFSRRVFWWLNKLFRQGYQKSLLLADLFTIDYDLSSQRLGKGLISTWNQHRHHAKKHTLAFCIASSFKLDLLAPVIPRLLLTGFIFTQPFLVQTVTNFMKESTRPAPDYFGYGLIGAYGIVYSGIALSNAWYWHKQFRFITMIRGSLVAIIYSKTLKIDLAETSGSQATTLMSADVERIAAGLRCLHELWAGALDLGIGLWLLYRQVGLAMLSMAGLIFASSFAISRISRYANARQKAWMEAMQIRLNDTITMLSSLKSIKMLGFENKLHYLVTILRKKEINACLGFRSTVTVVVFLSFTNQIISPVLVFAAFEPIAKKQSILFDIERVFNTLTLVALVGDPLMILLQSLPQISMALGCVNRIQAYLQAKETHDPRYFIKTRPKNQTIEGKSEEETILDRRSATYVVQNGHFGWVAGSSAVLKDVNVHIPAGKLTMVVGPVGCGKTTFLHALLGEIVQIRGEVFCSRELVGFCAQQPWLTNTTVRNIIIGHSEEDPKWYERVVSACALHIDFARFEKGDKTVVGSKGAALSGGQKQRLALARAVYSQRSILILDDVFSGLDKATERSVFNSLFGPEGIFRTSLPDTTVVLATHAVRHFKSADHIISLLPNGEGSRQGSFKELQSQGSLLYDTSYAKYLEQDWQSESDQEEDQAAHNTPKQNLTGANNVQSSESTAIDSDRGVLLFYIKSMRFWGAFFFFSLSILHIGLWKISNFWARLWSEHSVSHPTNPRTSFYIGIFALLNSSALVMSTISIAYFLLILVPRTGATLHERILSTALNATYPFMSRVDIGSLAARFGQDLLLIDTELMMAFLNTVFESLLLVAQLALIASASVYMLAAFPILAVVVFAVQRVYLRTSKRIRHLDLETKAPLYAQFTETLSGIATVRAFGWQDPSGEQNNALLNDSQRPFYLLYCVQRWLECVLDFTVAGLAVMVMSVAVVTRAKIGGAQIGVALLNLVTIGENTKALIKFWTVLETTIAAVARIRNFVDVTPQELLPPSGHGSVKKKLEESSGGLSVILDNVSAKYSPDGPNVLSSLSLHIKAGEKIAICGRSGSGKSSLLNVLLKIVEISEGEIRIGGRLSTSFGSQELRHLLNTIPQDPYFFPGSIRENLDPDSTFTDDEINACLMKVGLDSKIADQGGLGSDLAIDTFSAGQLQLLSLARAVLKPRGILFLDEATSNVDHDTDKKMHDIVFEDFSDQTVVAILHRREQLHRFDRVAVIDQGKLVSVGEPSTITFEL